MGGERFGTRDRDIGDICAFLVVLFATSTLFYIAGPLIGSLSGLTHASVPAAALAVVCPTIAAVTVAARAGSLREVGRLLARRPGGAVHIVIALVALPVVVVLSAILGGERNGFQLPGIGALILVVVYLAGSLAEEIGWTAFLLPRLLPFVGEVRSALVIGVVWALWHVIPYAQSGNPAWWILGQCVFTVVFRMLLVRLTVGSGGSVWLAVICHAAYNLAWSLSPDAGAKYNPWITAALTALVVAALYAGDAFGRRSVQWHPDSRRRHRGTS